MMVLCPRPISILLALSRFIGIFHRDVDLDVRYYDLVPMSHSPLASLN